MAHSAHVWHVKIENSKKKVKKVKKGTKNHQQSTRKRKQKKEKRRNKKEKNEKRNKKKHHTWTTSKPTLCFQDPTPQQPRAEVDHAQCEERSTLKIPNRHKPISKTPWRCKNPLASATTDTSISMFLQTRQKRKEKRKIKKRKNETKQNKSKRKNSAAINNPKRFFFCVHTEWTKIPSGQTREKRS